MSEIKALFVTSEISPFFKKGDIADISLNLASELKKNKVDVKIVAPFYKDMIRREKISYLTDFPVKFGSQEGTNIVFEGSINKVPIFFIKNFRYFFRDKMYGYHDDNLRFLYYCFCIPSLINSLEWKPDLIHLNDWQTAMVAVLLNSNSFQEFKDTKIIFSLHDVNHQGLFPYSKKLESLIDAGPDIFTYEKLEFWGKLSYLKAGLLYSDYVTTFGKNFDEKILKADFGNDIVGILKSIDYKYENIVEKTSKNNWGENSKKLKSIYKEVLKNEK